MMDVAGNLLSQKTIKQTKLVLALLAASAPIFAQLSTHIGSQCGDDGSIKCNGLEWSEVILNQATDFLHVWKDGRIENTRIENGANISLNQTGFATETYVKNGGKMLLKGSSEAATVSVEQGGELIITQSAKARNIVNEGSVILKDGTVDHITSQIIAGNTVSNITIQNGGVLSITSGIVNDAIINDGGQFYVDAGTKGNVSLNKLSLVSNTVINAGGLMKSTGFALAYSGINDTVINDGGRLIVNTPFGTDNTRVTKGGIFELENNQGYLSSLPGTASQVDTIYISDTNIEKGGTLLLTGNVDNHGGYNFSLGSKSIINGDVVFVKGSNGYFQGLDILNSLSGLALEGNGTFFLNTDIANLRGDKIGLYGQIEGNHTLVITDSGSARTMTVAPENDQLVVIDGMTENADGHLESDITGNATFSLRGGHVDSGAFRYVLERKDDNWLLVNAATVDTPEQPGKPVSPNIPVISYKGKGLSKSANAAVANHAGTAFLLSTQMSTLSNQLHKLHRNSNNTASEPNNNAWTTIYSRSQSLDLDTSRKFDQEAKGANFGADFGFDFSGNKLNIGGTFGMGETKQDLAENTYSKVRGTSVGIYGIYQSQQGIYVDGILQYTRLKNNVNSVNNVGGRIYASYSNNSYGVDLSIGKQFSLGSAWYIEPQLGFSAARTSTGNYVASNNLVAKISSLTSLQSRISGELGRDILLENGVSMKPYAKISAIYEHHRENKVIVNNTRLNTKLIGTRGEIGAGFKVTSKKHAFFVEANYNQVKNVKSGTTGNIGYSYSF